MTTDAQALDHEKAHPTAGLYIKIALVLFFLTALEVGAYEVVDTHSPASLAVILEPVIVAVLLVLSAVKFALVAMFYMHLKQDSVLYSGLFVFPILIAGVLITALILLFSYIATLF